MHNENTRPALTVKQLTSIVADLASEDGENPVYDAALMGILYDTSFAGGRIEVSNVIEACETIAVSAAYQDEAKRAAFELARDMLSVVDAWSDRELLLKLLLGEGRD